MTPEEKELNRQKRGEKNKEKMALERKQKRERQLKNADKAKVKAKGELKALNNIVTHTKQALKVREEFNKKAKATIGTSKNNREWKQKREDRYQQRVWKGWRETDGVESPVTVYKLEDLNK
ncbi:hypothetical protein AB9M62_25275 [Bacillales bacterium AN1005]